MSINVGEYGHALNVFVGYDMSLRTALEVTVTRPDQTTFTGSAVLGTAPLATDDGKFAANQYCTYTVKDGDLNQAGDYFARVIYTDGTKRLISDPTSFTVNP